MPRVPWDELPGQIRSWATDTLGSAVVSAASQPGGYSPGAACRLRLADGQRAFLKAVSAAANPESPDMHRRESLVAVALPPAVPSPRFLGQYDDGQWVALLFADAGGRHPAQPWDLAELAQVLDALACLHKQCTPSPVRTLPSVAEFHASSLSGWRNLAADRPGGVDDSSRRHVDRLAELESGWAAAASGDTLLHNDVRADNMLLTPDGVVFVDWPHACIGAPWFDVVAFAPSVALQGGPDLDWLLAHCPSAAAADPEALTAVAVAVAGYFTHQATLPPAPGLPTVREFQAAQGRPARDWLRQRTGLR